jgi:hypothetical protein
MAGEKTSKLISSLFYPLIDRGSVKFLKRLIGRTSVGIVLQRLNLLTEDCGAKPNESLVKLNDQNADMTRVIEGTARSRCHTSRQHCLSGFIYVLTSFPPMFQTIAEEIKCMSLHGGRILDQHDQCAHREPVEREPLNMALCF